MFGIQFLIRAIPLFCALTCSTSSFADPDLDEVLKKIEAICDQRIKKNNEFLIWKMSALKGASRKQTEAIVATLMVKNKDSLEN